MDLVILTIYSSGGSFPEEMFERTSNFSLHCWSVLSTDYLLCLQELSLLVSINQLKIFLRSDLNSVILENIEGTRTEA